MKKRMEADSQGALIDVFVYGTLRAGQANHHVMQIAHGTLLGDTCTEPAYELVDLGAFPGMVDGGTTAVVGELYRVTAEGLRALDTLEGHPTFYRRVAVQLTCGRWAQTYILPARYAAGYNQIQSGDWAMYRALRGARSGDGPHAGSWHEGGTA